MKFISIWILGASLLGFGASGLRAQNSPAAEPAALADLLNEAEKNNPQLQAARHAWQSAKQVPTQVSTLPDPQAMLQQMNVGSPRPFAGYTNSDFAYLGIGGSQDLPYPGKLRLKGEIAQKEADATQQKYESLRRTLRADLKMACFQSAYLAKRQNILDEDAQLLQQIEQAADSRYRNGFGNQQEVLQAQLERTKLLREINRNQLEQGKVQAALKNLLNRSQTSTDIETFALSESAPVYSFEQLLAQAKTGNPDLAGMQKMVERQGLQVDLAKKDFYPDFNVQYMWERTDPTQFRAYYMLSVGVRVPIYHGRKQRPELAQAEAEQLRARSELQAQSQQVAAELRTYFVTTQQISELLKIHREGLSPQSRSAFQAALVAYQSNKQDFQALLAAFLDVLRLDEEYWQNVSEHETAVARLEQITGLLLR